MNQITGIIMELKAKTCILLTRSGEFREVRRPLQQVRLGEEITAVPAKTAAAAWRPLLAAASIFLFLWAGFLYYGWLNEAVAYVGLDLNPSVELGINRRQRVCEASGLDEQGQALVQKVTLKGLPLDEAVQTVLTEAVAERYFQPAAENVVLTTVTAVEKQKQPAVEKQQISRLIQETLQKSGVKAEVVVEEAPAEVRREAKAAGLSTGKYLQRIRGLEKRELPGPAGAAGPPAKNAAGRDKNAGRGGEETSLAPGIPIFGGTAWKKGEPPWAPEKWVPGKWAPAPPEKRGPEEEKEAEKKEPEKGAGRGGWNSLRGDQDALRGKWEAPGGERDALEEVRRPVEEIKKQLDEIRPPLQNLFPPGKRPFDEWPGLDREQPGPDQEPPSLEQEPPGHEQEPPGHDREQARGNDRVEGQAKTGGQPFLNRAAGPGQKGFFAFPEKDLQKPPSPLPPGNARELSKPDRLFPGTVPRPAEKPVFDFFRKKDHEAKKTSLPREWQERPALPPIRPSGGQAGDKEGAKHSLFESVKQLEAREKKDIPKRK